ncbi:MAG: hemolysin family protein [bacterium]
MITETVVLVFLLALSGIFSSMETSLATLNKAKIKALLELKKQKIFRDWLIKPTSVFSTILVGNNLVNIAFSSLLSFYIMSALISRGVSSGASSFLALIAASTLILFFGEIMPKNIATTYPRKVSETFGGFLNFTGFILSPFTELLAAASNRLVGSEKASSDLRISRVDINELSMSTTHADSGALPGADGVNAFSKIISKVLSLSHLTTGEIMTPRKEITGLDLNMDWERIKTRIVDSGISRFPAYYGGLKNLAGILYTREICNALIMKKTIGPVINKTPPAADDRLTEGSSAGFSSGATISSGVDLKQYVHKPFYIDEKDSALNAYRKMVKNRIHIAVVVNDKFRIRGIITMEDLLEEVFGPILDEYDLKRE